MDYDKNAFLAGYQTGRRLRMMQYKGAVGNNRSWTAPPEPQEETTEEAEEEREEE